MKKALLLIGALSLTSVAVSGQVGVNTTAPSTTMDVSAKRDSGGTLTDNTQLIGLQAPRLTRAELTANTATYGTSQQGALIYITDVSGGTALGQRVNIDAAGYYSFDGNVWQKMKISDVNIYNNNGSLTSNRTLTNNGFALNFVGSEQSTIWSATGALTQRGTANTKRSSITLLSDDNDGNGVTSRLNIFQDAENIGQISTTADSKGLGLSTNTTTLSAPITFSTSAGSNASATQKMIITGTGNIGINTSIPTEKLDNNGITRLRTLPLNGAANAINTNSSGNASSAQDQTFTATRTVVADANGVLGYVTGLPSTGSGTPTGSISVGQTISTVYSVPIATATTSGWRLGDYVTANGLTALPLLDGLQMDLLGYSSDYYTPIIENASSAPLLISYQTFATQVNENRTNLNQTLSPCPFGATTFSANLWDGNNTAGWRGVDANNIVFWNTSNAEVETTNLQVQVDASTYRWYEFKWWCMEVSGQKKIFLSVTRKA
jgi:hypothetical protein